MRALQSVAGKVSSNKDSVIALHQHRKLSGTEKLLPCHPLTPRKSYYHYYCCYYYYIYVFGASEAQKTGLTVKSKATELNSKARTTESKKF